MHGLTVFFYSHNGGLDVAVLALIDLQCFFLGTLGGVGPVALGRLFNTIDIALLTSADPYFLEVVSAFVVVQGVNSEDLLLLHGRQSENGTDLSISVLELALVEQNFNVGVVDDGFFHYRGINHIIQLLRDDTGNAVELSDGLI